MPGRRLKGGESEAVIAGAAHVVLEDRCSERFDGPSIPIDGGTRREPTVNHPRRERRGFQDPTHGRLGASRPHVSASTAGPSRGLDRLLLRRFDGCFCAATTTRLLRAAWFSPLGSLAGAAPREDLVLVPSKRWLLRSLFYAPHDEGGNALPLVKEPPLARSTHRSARIHGRKPTRCFSLSDGRSSPPLRQGFAMFTPVSPPWTELDRYRRPSLEPPQRRCESPRGAKG